MAENEPITQEPIVEEQQEDVTPKTFTQEELDNIIKEKLSAAIVKTKNEEKAKYQKQMQEKEENAKKQAAFEKMSELEKYKAIAEDSQREHQALLDKIALGEQKDETRKLMKEKGLPESFLDAVLIPKDAEATIAKIEEIKGLFDAEVQKAVEAKIPTIVPKQSTEKTGDILSVEAARRAVGLKPL